MKKGAQFWSNQYDNHGQPDLGAFEHMVEAKSLQDIRNRLCMLVSKYKLLDANSSRRLGSAMSSMSNSSNMSKQSSRPTTRSKNNQSPGAAKKQLNFFKPPVSIDPCLGSGCYFRENQKDKKISECIFITYADFVKLYNTRRALSKSTSGIPDLAVDFIKTVTLNLFDLKTFESLYGDYRDANGPFSPFKPKPLDQVIKINDS